MEKYQNAMKRLGVFFGILVLVWVASTITWFAPVFHLIRGAMYWVSTGAAQAASRIFAEEDSLANQLRICEVERAEQGKRAAMLAQAADEASQWRELFLYSEREAPASIAARVIARGALASSDVVIDRGADAGIRSGSAVAVGEGHFFGTILAVSATESIVRLSEDPRSAIPAQIFGLEKTIGIVEGNDGAVLTMKYIPQDATIAVGDSVVTSGLGGAIVPGLLLGTVTEISHEPSAPFMTATITPLFDARAWTVVAVSPRVEPAL
jgi:rod shape-determining protein MreC